MFANRTETVGEECIDNDVAKALLAYLQFNPAPAKLMVSDPITKDVFLKAADCFCMDHLTELINEWSSSRKEVELCDRCLMGFKRSENTRDSCQGTRGISSYHYARRRQP